MRQCNFFDSRRGRIPLWRFSCKAACSVVSLLVQSTVLDENAAVLADMRIIALLLGGSNWGMLSTCRLTNRRAAAQR